MADDDGGGARPRHRARRDRPARAHRRLPRRDRRTSRRARIYARTTPGRARAEADAAAARARADTRRGPLDGVPISWKDLFDTAGIATEAGSRLLAGRVPEADAEVLATATRAGLVCLGKTHLTELAFTGLGVNPVTATPPNVNDPALAPGGSSSGAATSVAFGLAAAGIGSDTGGSVRVPAAWNDLVGFKTTHGWLSLEGVVPLRPDFDTVGPLCRSVEDAALVTAALTGTRAADLEGATLAGVRILAFEDEALFPTREGPAAATAAALERLAAAGATIERGCPQPAADANALWGAISAPEAWATWGATIETNPGVMFAPVLERFRGGADRDAAEYIAARVALARVRVAWRAATAGYDVVALPTTANLPPEVAAVLADPAHFAAENLLALRNTNLGNLLGVCAITLPTGTPFCGLMLMAPGGEDARLLRLAAAAERALA